MTIPSDRRMVILLEIANNSVEPTAGSAGASEVKSSVTSALPAVAHL